MIHKMARYVVGLDKIERTEEAIKTFVNNVGENEEGALAYNAFREGETSTFTHFMTFIYRDAEGAHKSAPHTTAFVKVLYPLCLSGPEFYDLNPIGRVNCLVRE